MVGCPIDIARRTAHDESCKPEERERACRVIEKLAKFSYIETPKPRGTVDKVIESFKKMWTGVVHGEKKKTTSILENTARSEKLLNFTESSLPLDDSFYSKVNSSIKDSSKRRKRSGGNVSMIGITRRDLKKLYEFSSKVENAKDVIELGQIIDEALQAGIRLRFYKNNFVNLVMDKISQLNAVVQNPEVVSSIVCKLASKGADVKEEINEELEDVFQEHNANVEKACCEYEKFVNDFRTVAASALSSGKVAHVEMDNKALYLGYSQDSVVDAATVAYEAKRLGCTEGTIAFDEKNEIKFEVQNGIRNYMDMSDGGNIELVFPTSLEELKVTLCSDGEKIRVIVSEGNRTKLQQLQDKGKDVGKNCLLWGLPVSDAIEQGYVPRHECSDMSAETVKKVEEKAVEIAKAGLQGVTSILDDVSSLKVSTEKKNSKGIA